MADDRNEQFEALYRYYPAVVALLLRLGFEREDARDLAQRIFVRVYEHMGAYRGESKWSCQEKTTRRLASNEIRDRHAAKRNGISVPTEAIVELADQRQAPDASFESKETTERVQRAIERLSSSDQTAIRLRLAGDDYQAIAKLLGTTPLALKSRLNAARKRLREILGEDLEGMGGNDDP